MQLFHQILASSKSSKLVFISPSIVFRVGHGGTGGTALILLNNYRPS